MSGFDRLTENSLFGVSCCRKFFIFYAQFSKICVLGQPVKTLFPHDLIPATLFLFISQGLDRTDFYAAITRFTATTTNTFAVFPAALIIINFNHFLILLVVKVFLRD